MHAIVKNRSFTKLQSTSHAFLRTLIAPSCHVQTKNLSFPSAVPLRQRICRGPLIPILRFSSYLSTLPSSVLIVFLLSTPRAVAPIPLTTTSLFSALSPCSRGCVGSTCSFTSLHNSLPLFSRLEDLEAAH